MTVAGFLSPYLPNPREAIYNKQAAGVVELVDAGDSKSPGESLCRFESGLRHQLYINLNQSVTWGPGRLVWVPDRFYVGLRPIPHSPVR